VQQEDAHVFLGGVKPLLISETVRGDPITAVGRRGPGRRVISHLQLLKGFHRVGECVGSLSQDMCFVAPLDYVPVALIPAGSHIHNTCNFKSESPMF
jgi:hypothetical protein